MFGIATQSSESLDALVLSLESSEQLIRQIRGRQLEILATLDSEQVAVRDGARSLRDWVAARLDMDPDGARDLVEASRLLEDLPAERAALAAGDISFDRAFATARLAQIGAGDKVLEASATRDIAGVRRLIARHRRTTRRQDHEAFADHYLAIQPSLDESTWRIFGQLAGIDGRLVDQALTVQSDRLPAPVQAESRPQRNAHALVAIAQDSLGGEADGRSSSSSGPTATVFVEAGLAALTDGETGAEIAAGPPVGPATLERILCEGAVQVVALQNLKPIAASSTARAIPPAVRRFVLWRDGGCAIDGCSSRYRLQPHHIVPWSRGGSHDPDNLSTLCWYHHHVAIHGSGFRLDPDSPPQRRRLIPPAYGPDPP